MPKKKTTGSALTIMTVRKGEIYETKHRELIEIHSGRLKDEGDLGTSFDARAITFNAKTRQAERAKTAERHYLDDLARKLTKAEYEEWIQAGVREAEASVEGEVDKSKPAKDKAANTNTAKVKSGGKLSVLDAAFKVLTEAGEPMTTGAMIEAMAAKNYWVSPGGKTPAATLYAAILREINAKGKDARFSKSDRGHFTAK